MNTKEAVDLVEETLRACLDQARQNGGGARFAVERLDGKPRRPKEPCVKLRAYSPDEKRQAYLLYVGSEDGGSVQRRTYDGKFLVNPAEFAPDKITAAQIVADAIMFSSGVVAPLAR